MSSRRVRHPSFSSMPVVCRLALVAVACVAGLAPFTHLVSASVAPIVHEDGASRSPTAAATASVRRRARLVARARRPRGRRPARETVGSVLRTVPTAAARPLTILRL